MIARICLASLAVAAAAFADPCDLTGRWAVCWRLKNGNYVAGWPVAVVTGSHMLMDVGHTSAVLQITWRDLEPRQRDLCQGMLHYGQVTGTAPDNRTPRPRIVGPPSGWELRDKEASRDLQGAAVIETALRLVEILPAYVPERESARSATTVQQLGPIFGGSKKLRFAVDVAATSR